MDTLEDLSVIIPVSFDETAWKDLLKDLKALPRRAEIILVGPNKPPLDFLSDANSPQYRKRLRWISSNGGRGAKLNAGAGASQRKYLWFLHADSRVTQETVSCMRESILKDPDALHFCKMEFLSDGPWLMWLNQLGCCIRSEFMGLPFGNQGFCISRRSFELAGGFPEDVPYGEDHLFVWRARKRGIQLCCTKGVIKTSARHYSQDGWGPHTWTVAERFFRQAVPEYVSFMAQKMHLL